jgi:hypothetical protein
MERATGGQPYQSTGCSVQPVETPAEDPLHDERDLPPTLSEIGINYAQSSRWQAIASLPEEVFASFPKTRNVFGMVEKLCKVCEKPVPRPRRGPVGDYCGRACKQKAYRLRELDRKRRLLSQRPG